MKFAIKAIYIAQEADMIIGVVTMTSERYAEFDLIFQWTVSSFTLLIPVIDPLANVKAPWQPFEIHIWILIIASIAVVPLCLHLFSFLLRRVSILHSTATDQFFARYEHSTEYVVAVLLSQGKGCLIDSFELVSRVICCRWSLLPEKVNDPVGCWSLVPGCLCAR
jgi:hypothetical protein